MASVENDQAIVSMRILDRYVIRQFLRYYLLFVLFFVAVFLLTEAFTSFGVMSEGTQVLKLITYYALEVPYLIVLLSPVAVIIAGLFAASYLGSTNQLQAIQVSGISMKRAMLPLFVVGACISLVVLVADNTVIYEANKKGVEIRQESFGGIAEEATYQNIFIAVPPHYVFYIRSLDVQQETMSDVLICEYGEKTRILFAPLGRRVEGGWLLVKAKKHLVNEELQSEALDTLFLPVDHDASYFSRSYFPPERMSVFVLQQRIEEYRASGFNVSTLEAELQTKIAYPFGNFVLIVVALALGVILRRGRGASLAVGLLMAFGYYQLTAFAKSLGTTAAGSPLILAWTPNLLFLVVGAYLIYRMD